MKNIYVMNLDTALKEFRNRKKKYAVLYIFNYYSRRKGKQMSIDQPIKEDKYCVEVFELPIDSDGSKFLSWHADTILRLCERSFYFDDVYFVYNDRFAANKGWYYIAMNIAYELANCYGVGFDFDNNTIPELENIRKMLRAKHTKISNSPLHTMPPMEYCKYILGLTFDQIRQSLKGKTGQYADGLFFCDHQCEVMLKSGLHLCFHLETFVENIYLPDMDDIEYVLFRNNVPDIVDSSTYEDSDRSYYRWKHFSLGKYGICDYYRFGYNYDSIDGLTFGNAVIPEKYKEYRTIQREYWEFYKSKAKDHIYPKSSDAYLGFVNAERFLTERNGYSPLFTILPNKIKKKILCYNGYKADEFFDWLISIVKEKNEFYADEFETACAYAAFLYANSLLDCGHCENLTVIKYFFENRYVDLKEDVRFKKLWNINKYTPSTDSDTINQICLAMYALIETVRPFNGKKISKGTYEKCLEKIYELTEGSPELNNAVIMAGIFAGAYCQPIVE